MLCSKNSTPKKSSPQISDAVLPMAAFAALPLAANEHLPSSYLHSQVATTIMSSTLTAKAVGAPTPPPEPENTDVDSISSSTRRGRITESRGRKTQSAARTRYVSRSKPPKNHSPQAVAEDAVDGEFIEDPTRSRFQKSGRTFEFSSMEMDDGFGTMSRSELPTMKRSDDGYPEADAFAPTSILKSASNSAMELDTAEEGNSLVNRLKVEIASQRQVIRNLNIQLSQCMPQPNKAAAANWPLLPEEGQIPEWLVNVQYLVPMITMYQQQIKQKDDALLDIQDQTQSLTQQMRQIIYENERLHLKLEENGVSKVPANRNQSQLLISQTKLVLEENQLLLEQLDIQQEKAKCAHGEYMNEITMLKKQLNAALSEKAALQNDLMRYPSPRSPTHQNYRMSMETGTFRSSLESVHFLSNEEKLEKVLIRLDETQNDLRTEKDKVADLSAEKSCLVREIKGLKHSLKEMHRKNALLKTFVKEEQTKKGYMTDVVQLAHSVAEERDALTNTLREREAQFSALLHQLVEKLHLKTSMHSTPGSQHLMELSREAILKLHSSFDEMQNELNELRASKHNLEREVIYLRSMLNEKEVALKSAKDEQGKVEARLESVWRAALHDKAIS